MSVFDRIERVKLFEMNQVAVLDVIDRFGRDRERGVWSVRDDLLEAARVSMAIRRQCIDPKTIGICHDKFKTRKALAQASLNSARGKFT